MSVLFSTGSSPEERVEARAWAAQVVVPRNRLMRPPARMDLSNRMVSEGLSGDGRGRSPLVGGAADASLARPFVCA